MVAYNTIMHAWLSLLGNDDHVRSMHKAIKPVNCLVSIQIHEHCWPRFGKHVMAVKGCTDMWSRINEPIACTIICTSLVMIPATVLASVSLHGQAQTTRTLILIHSILVRNFNTSHRGDLENTKYYIAHLHMMRC